MPTSFRPYAPGQLMLVPQDIREWVPQGHLAYHISDIVDELDLSEFYRPYKGNGRRNSPYDPSMMLKVLIYSYATGVFSSRKIGKRLEEDVATRMLAAGNFPQHRTLCEFRRRHLEDFGQLFVKVVEIAREMGAARFGTLSIDGTKVRANASKRKAMSYDRMLIQETRLKKEINALLTQAGAVDDEENVKFGDDVRGDDFPKEFQCKEKRLQAVQEAQGRLEAAQRETDDTNGRKPKQDSNSKGGLPKKRDEGEVVDGEQDAQLCDNVQGDDLVIELELREKRLQMVQEARQRLEVAQRAKDDARGRKPGQDRNPKGGSLYKRAYGEPDPKAQSNFIDPESRIMKTSTEGIQQGYNAQTVVDGEHQIIVATHVGSEGNDQGQMMPLLDPCWHFGDHV